MNGTNGTEQLSGTEKSGAGLLASTPAQWHAWWKSLTTWQRIWPAFFAFTLVLVFFALNGLTRDHVLMATLALALGYTGPRARKLLIFVFPLLLTAAVYDSQRFYGPYLKAEVNVSEPYLIEKRFFGIETATGVLTPNEWWQLRTHPALDLITGFFYLTFIAIFVLIAGYFQFFRSRRGTGKMPAEELGRRAPSMMWGFFWVNLLGYSTYLWYPAAPPWYVAKYGFLPADPSTPADPAGAIRFDELLGVEIFSDMYSKSADVFGAIPSLHVAYPLLALIFCFRFGALRMAAVVYFAGVSFSAVYLNHHYFIDVIWGWAYAVMIAIVMEWWYGRVPKSRLT